MKQNINIEFASDYKVIEAVRRLSINISSSYPEVKSILVSSVAGKEGKSYVSKNLAQELAERGNQVLYINGDIRGQLSENVGLTDYMTNTTSQEKIVYGCNCNNLSVIPNGKGKAIINEVLLKELMINLQATYDYIIVDSPSLGESADGIIMGKICDGILLVIEPEIVPEKKLLKVKEELERSGCNILGVVLNKERN